MGALLNRLGGLYRDPSRVDRDASSLLKSSVGQHLTPNIAPLVENNGDSHSTLVLQGTIAMHFRGNTYQLLVDIYLPAGYPSRPPSCYVRLGAPNMYLKEGHQHVGSDGHVYLPYLHEWRAHSHNLVELVVAMSSVFSADPPVFTRSTPAAASSSSGYKNNSGYTTTTTSTLDRDTQQQVEAAMIREAEEASRQEEARRQARLCKQREEEEEMKRAQLAFEQRKARETKQALAKKLHSYLLDTSHQTQRRMQGDSQDQARLNRNQLQKQIEFLKQTKSSLEKNHAVMDKATVDIQAWLQEQQENSTTTTTTTQQKETSVDDVTLVSHTQMLELAAENAALTDALYFFDVALQKGTLELNSHLKHVRQVAKRQFLVRAHLEKIAQVQAIKLTTGSFK